MPVAHSMVRLNACMVLAASLLAGQLRAQSSAKPVNPLDQLSNSLTELTEHVSPAVVEIQVWSDGSAEEGGNTGDVTAKQQIVGSGVILRPDGYIVTNAHVVAGAQRVRVILNFSRVPGLPLRDYSEIPERTYEAKVLGVDQDTDLAVIKIDATNLSTLSVANYDDLRQGQVVVAIGTPLGLKNAATIGIVSSVARRLEQDSPVVYIQTDAAVNPGSSGGALVDTSGRLVGIVSSMLDADRIGLAIPSDTVKFVFDQIRASGRVMEGDIGLHAQTITPLLAEGLGLPKKSGVIISDVVPDLPADKAGLQPQDVVLSMDGQSPEGAAGFVTAILHKKPGEHISLRVLRGAREFLTDVPVIERGPQHNAVEAMNPHKTLIRALGVAAVDFGQEQGGTPADVRVPSGILVIGKGDDDDDPESRLKPGDIIQSVNGTHVSSIDELVSVLGRLPSRAAAVLRVERQKTFLYVVFEAR